MNAVRYTMQELELEVLSISWTSVRCQLEVMYTVALVRVLVESRVQKIKVYLV